MSTLLISMLGGSHPGSGQPGHPRAIYRLPGGERIVETSNLGVELARALQVKKLCLVGTPRASFDKLAALLPADQAEAIVPEPPPAIHHEEEPAASEPEPVPADDRADQPEAQPEEAAAPPADMTATAAEPAATEPATAEPVTDETGTSEPDSGGSAPAEVEAEDPPAAEQGADEPAPAEVEAEDPPAAEQGAAEPEAPEAAPAEPDAESPEPATARDPEPGADAPAESAAPPPTRARPPLPQKAHEPDLRPLKARLEAQAATGRADRGALAALSERLATALGFEEVQCVLISAPTDDRSFQASLRDLTRLPADGDEVHLDVTYGERTLPLLGTLAMHYMTHLGRRVKPGRIFQGAPEHADEHGVAPVLTLEAPLEMMHWMTAFEGLRHGSAPDGVRELMNNDRRLQGLAGPYVRFQRGVQFGALSEVVQGAKLLEERRRRLHKLPYAHRYRLFDHLVADAVKPFTTERPSSHLQVEMASQAIRAGHFTFAALHLREAILSYCLELFGQAPTRIWADVPQSGGAQEVRLRDVAGYVLGSPETRQRCPDLELAWPLLNEARRQYGNIPGSTVHASLLKQACHEINRLHHIVQGIVHKDVLRGIEEGRSFENVIKESIDRLAVRPREARKRRRRTRDGSEGGERRGRRTTRGEGRRGTEGGRRGTESGRRGGPGRRREGPPRPREPRGDETESATPRVEHARGMGNLGLALKGAGLVSEEKNKKKRKQAAAPGADETPVPDAPAPTAEAASPEAAPPATPPAPPAEPVQETPEATPRKDATPEPPADTPADSGTFDVAGPGGD